MLNKMNEILHRWNKNEQRCKSNSDRRTAESEPAVDPFTAHYESLGIPSQLCYPSTTLGQLLDQSAERFADAPALIYGELAWNYAQLQQQVNRLAGGLASLGVQRGQRVLMTLPNCPEFVTAFFAIQKLGAVVVNAGPLMGADDLSRLVSMTKPRLVIALDLQAPALSRVCNGEHRLWISLKSYQPVWKKLAYRAKLWQSRNQGNATIPQESIHELMSRSPSRPPTVAPTPDDLAVLQPTGGTTGKLKVAQLTHRNLISNAVQMSIWVRLRPAQERVLGILPMFHVYGLSACLTSAIYNAALMLPLTRFNVDQVIETIVQHRPSVLPLAPVIIEAMCDKLEREPNPALGEMLQKTIVISGAAPLTPLTSQRFEHITGVRIIQGYGLTEASPVTHANPLNDRREGSIGLPLPDTRVRVINLNDRTSDAPPGEPGELWITGPQIMQGYFKCSDEKERILSVDEQGRRWLHTGDVVRVDDDGFFSVVDRQKEMINRGGLKVWPAKIEQLILTHSQVKDAAVIGRTDPVHTEIVTALIVTEQPGAGEEKLTDELRALCRKHLAPYEVPGQFEFLKELPRNPLGKMLKHQLRKAVPKNTGGNGTSVRQKNTPAKETESIRKEVL